jgi:hypothetical protein
MKPSHPTLDELFEAQIQILATTLRPNTVKQYSFLRSMLSHLSSRHLSPPAQTFSTAP